jgi:transcriptional regulator with XRE-family HTH domain
VSRPEPHFRPAFPCDSIRDTVTRSDGQGDTETLGERLKRILGERGMSQVDLAKALAGPRAPKKRIESVRRQVVRWANDKTLPDDDSAARLATALRTPPDCFVTARTNLPLAEAVSALAEGLSELRADLRELRDRVQVLEGRRARRGQR